MSEIYVYMKQKIQNFENQTQKIYYIKQWKSKFQNIYFLVLAKVEPNEILKFYLNAYASYM